MNLNYSHNTEIEKAYIITIKGHSLSEELSKRCQESCDKVGMPYQIWQAYDGTGNVIIEPDAMIGDSIMNSLKLTNHDLSNSEISCALSNISLWVHCMKIDKPIVILEHDAIMLNRISNLATYNSIVYLGCAEWAEQGLNIFDIPLHGTDGHNNHYMLRTHAYAIDPQVAKNLVCHVLRMGIYNIVDRMMRCDLFNITHQGLYAYDKGRISTITKK